MATTTQDRPRTASRTVNTLTTGKLPKAAPLAILGFTLAALQARRQRAEHATT